MVEVAAEVRGEIRGESESPGRCRLEVEVGRAAVFVTGHGWRCAVRHEAPSSDEGLTRLIERGRPDESDVLHARSRVRAGERPHEFDVSGGLEQRESCDERARSGNRTVPVDREGPVVRATDHDDVVDGFADGEHMAVHSARAFDPLNDRRAGLKLEQHDEAAGRVGLLVQNDIRVRRIVAYYEHILAAVHGYRDDVTEVNVGGGRFEGGGDESRLEVDERQK